MIKRKIIQRQKAAPAHSRDCEMSRGLRFHFVSSGSECRQYYLHQGDGQTGVLRQNIGKDTETLHEDISDDSGPLSGNDDALADDDDALASKNEQFVHFGLQCESVRKLVALRLRTDFVARG
jgi:hypothetical protein